MNSAENLPASSKTIGEKLEARDLVGMGRIYEKFIATDIATLAFIAIMTLLVFALDNIIMGLIGLVFLVYGFSSLVNKYENEIANEKD
jgi:hypothetical protein